MRLPARLAVPLNSICSSTWERPAPSHLPSWMLPVMAQDWADTTGALWSSRTMMVRPLSSVVVVTPGGRGAISPFEVALLIELIEWQKVVGNGPKSKGQSPQSTVGLGFRVSGFESRLLPPLAGFGAASWILGFELRGVAPGRFGLI